MWIEKSILYYDISPPLINNPEFGIVLHGSHGRRLHHHGWTKAHHRLGGEEHAVCQLSLHHHLLLLSLGHHMVLGTALLLRMVSKGHVIVVALALDGVERTCNAGSSQAKRSVIVVFVVVRSV